MVKLTLTVGERLVAVGVVRAATGLNHDHLRTAISLDDKLWPDPKEKLEIGFRLEGNTYIWDEKVEPREFELESEEHLFLRDLLKKRDDGKLLNASDGKHMLGLMDKIKEAK